VRAIAKSLAVHLIRTYPDSTGSARMRRGELPVFELRRITNLIEAHRDEEFQLVRLAEEAGMSESHFSRIFKKTTGLSRSQFFIRLRMEKARQLLRETNKTM
jgi:AraC family transcriptional regulator